MEAVKILLKVILIIIGGLMLAGGGFCAATNVVIIVPNLARGDISLFGVLFGISAAVAVVGFLLLKLAVSAKFLNSPQQEESGTASEDSNEINK